MATPSSSFDLLKLLNKIDNFSDSDQVEKLRLLAAAIVPYGSIEKSTVIEIYHKLKSECREGAIPIITRLLDRAGFQQKFIEQLQAVVPACETADVPRLYFTELLVAISDELGKGDYLRKLKNRIPDEQLGVSRDRIPTAVQLFQRLLFEDTIALEKEIESLTLLAEWLGDIGRRDIAVKVEREKKEREAKLNAKVKPKQGKDISGEESATGGTAPVSESTQKTATSDDDTSEKPLARPVEEQSERNT